MSISTRREPADASFDSTEATSRIYKQMVVIKQQEGAIEKPEKLIQPPHSADRYLRFEADRAPEASASRAVRGCSGHSRSLAVPVGQ